MKTRVGARRIMRIYRTESLAGIEIFGELSPEALQEVARKCRWRRYAANQTIIQCQDDSRDVFCIVRGRVCAIYHSASGREVRFSDLRAGAIFGEFAAIDGGRRSADVISVTETLIASMSAELFWETLRRHETVWAAI